MVTWAHWHTEPLLLGGILFVTWLYLALVGPLRGWVAPGAAYPRRELFWFLGTAASFYVAVGSPLDALGEGFLFSAHMVQHNLFMYVSAVGLLNALPPWLVDGLLRKAPRLQPVARVLVHPACAGFCFTAVFCGWHFPALYEAALRSKPIHALEHLTMFATSVQMLWCLRSRSALLPPSPFGVQLLYVFILMVAQIPLFGILVFSPEVLYPTYEFAPRVCFLTPAEDQVLGGLIMKVANMAVSMTFYVQAFIRWNREA